MMGYILPINDYQYSNERIRINKSKRTAESVERPYKTVLEKHLQDQKGEYDRLNHGKTNNLNKAQSASFKETLTAISGKGQHFNEKI